MRGIEREVGLGHAVFAVVFVHRSVLCFATLKPAENTRKQGTYFRSEVVADHALMCGVQREVVLGRTLRVIFGQPQTIVSHKRLVTHRESRISETFACTEGKRKWTVLKGHGYFSCDEFKTLLILNFTSHNVYVQLS